jgi:hypothetical protein
MNLLCPNCQKMLTVPEQYAGQLMKCPLCNGTFTVPALPQTAALPPPVAPGPPPPPPAPEVYPLRHEPEPVVPPAPPPAPGTFQPEPAQPFADLQGPPVPRDATTAVPPPPAPPPEPSAGYQRTLTVWFSPKVIEWVAPVAVVLVFLFQIFSPWLGIYLGGLPAVTQSAWGAAFGSYTADGELEDQTPVKEDAGKPGVNWLMIFYLLPFVFIVLPVTVGCVVLKFVNVKLPPAVEQLMPWRWGIVAAANLFVFLFLALQLLPGVGFSLESKAHKQIDNQIKELKDRGMSAKQAEIMREMKYDTLHRTVWLKLSVVLHLLAIFSAGFMFWVGQRGTSRPLPRLELMW